jgi:hypothetical protein
MGYFSFHPSFAGAIFPQDRHGATPRDACETPPSFFETFPGYGAHGPRAKLPFNKYGHDEHSAVR